MHIKFAGRLDRDDRRAGRDRGRRPADRRTAQQARSRPARPARWIAWYVALALAFSVFLWSCTAARANSEFLASYVTEYSLSADNLFVFMLLIARFKVPEIAVDRVLYVGILISLVFRAAFIAAGIGRDLGLQLGVLHLRRVLALHRDPAGAGPERATSRSKKRTSRVKLLRRALRTTNEYDGDRFVTMVDGRRAFTPAILVIGAIAVANVVFALDSIPAVFGITKNAYLVLTANAFAMMGLRQLYFLIGDLLKRLVYLEHRALGAARVHRGQADLRGAARFARHAPRRGARPGHQRDDLFVGRGRHSRRSPRWPASSAGPGTKHRRRRRSPRADAAPAPRQPREERSQSSHPLQIESDCTQVDVCGCDPRPGWA